MLKIVVALALCSAILVPMAKDDWDDTYVSGKLCLLAWIIVGVSWFLCGRSIPQLVILAMLCTLFYTMPDSVPFSSADIIPLAMYVAVYTQGIDWVACIIMYPLCILPLLVPYGKLYAKKHNIEWSYGDKIAMPVLPCLAAGWWLSGIAYITYTLIVGS